MNARPSADSRTGDVLLCASGSRAKCDKERTAGAARPIRGKGFPRRQVRERILVPANKKDLSAPPGRADYDVVSLPLGKRFVTSGRSGRADQRDLLMRTLAHVTHE